MLILISCSSNSENTKNVIIKNSKESPESKDTDISIFNKIETIHFPFIDSTNFDNFKPTNELADKMLDILHLKSIHKDADHFYIQYKAPFSNHFKSIIVTYQVGEHELFTSLINYNNNYEIIDNIVISYDEIAESMFRIESNLSTNLIQVNKSSWIDENLTLEIERYEVLKNGKFKLKS